MDDPTSVPFPTSADAPKYLDIDSLDSPAEISSTSCTTTSVCLVSLDLDLPGPEGGFLDCDLPLDESPHQSAKYKKLY